MLFRRLLTVEGIIRRRENPLSTLYFGKVTLMKKEPWETYDELKGTAGEALQEFIARNPNAD